MELTRSTPNSEKLNQAGFNFPSKVIVPVYVLVQFNEQNSQYNNMNPTAES